MHCLQVLQRLCFPNRNWNQLEPVTFWEWFRKPPRNGTTASAPIWLKQVPRLSWMEPTCPRSVMGLVLPVLPFPEPQGLEGDPPKRALQPLP